MEQELWALDLCLHYSDHLAMFRLMEYVTHGVFQPETHAVEVTKSDDNKPRRRRLAGQEEDVSLENIVASKTIKTAT